MYYIKGDDAKIQINLLKVLQSINTNDYATLKLLLDNFVKSYGVLTEETCLLKDELKVESVSNNKIKIKKGTAIFPINAYFLVDGEKTNVNREIIAILKLDNDLIMPINAVDSFSFYVVLTADKNYFNEILGQKPYTNPIEDNIKAIYELKPKIELIKTDAQNIILEQNTSLIKKENKRYGFCLAIININYTAE